MMNTAFSTQIVITVFALITLTSSQSSSIVPTTAAASTPAASTSGTCIEKYTPWLTRGVCNDTCGGYGQMQLIRACVTGCTCQGPFTMYTLCAQALCAFPRATCDTSVGLAKYLYGTNWYCGFGNGL
ncbi:unnamed protein product, partial [Mesorhabditis belari]|uniref:Uncharacterized protein n=1 Tax=Mesorhabditis belari TaxID=2138241 RepID=A0AAF3FE14_9BILA